MNSKHFNSLNDFYKEKFGCKVIKVSLDLGFSCPNKDGTKGTGGCIFCNGVVGVGNKSDDLKTQFLKVRDILSKKWPHAKYIVFFEANTNTYASLNVLKKYYEEVLTYKDVVGLSIATRCDSITDEVLGYLVELNKRTFLSIELGLQSSHDETLRFINRGHTVSEFTECVARLKKYDINVVVHIINGFPNENEDMMLKTINYINELKIDGIKFHMLYIEEGTHLAKMYIKKPFHLLSREEYVNILGKQLALLDEKIVVHRLLSDPNISKLIEPLWLKGKFVNLNFITRYLEQNNIYQGSKKEL